MSVDGADPAVVGRQRAAQEPAVRAVGEADPVLDVQRRSSTARFVPGFAGRGRILRVDEVLPGDRSVPRQPRQFVPALVPVGDHAVRVRRPDDLRHRVGERAVAHLALALDRGELLLGEKRVAPPQLHRLLPELDEDGDLRPQHERVERLHQVVDRARAVAAEHVLGVLRDRGQEEDRDVPRPLALLDQLRGLEAVHARHLDVEQDRRELLVEQAPQRLLARGGPDEVGLERLQDRLQGEQVLRPVVDEQQLRPVGHRRAQPVEERCDLVEREHGVRDRAGDRGVRHRPPLRRVRVLDDRDAAVALDRRQAGGAVLVRAREHDPDRAVAVDLGDRLEEHVDRRPRELDARVDREGEVAVLDEEVVVGRSDVDVARLERLLVARLGDGPADVALQQRLEHAAARLGRAVLGDHDRLVELLRNPLEQRSHCLQPSPGRADRDHLVAHRTLLEQPLVGVELLELALVRAEPDRLLLSQREHAERRQAVVEEAVHALLQRLREVDQHVAARDHVELVEGRRPRRGCAGRRRRRRRARARSGRRRSGRRSTRRTSARRRRGCSSACTPASCPAGRRRAAPARARPR